MKSIDIVSKIVAREGEAKASPSKGIQSINLSDYLLKSVWDKVFEVRTDSQGTEYIFGKLPMVAQYGITMYSGDDVDVPSLASGLPFDGRTIWYNPDTQQIEVIGGTGGGSGEGVSNFWDLSGIPSWITNSKPKYTYSEIEGTPDLTKYALVSQIPSLSGYATESWVKNQGYLTQHQDLSGYQPLITSSNKLAYSLVSGTPTSLKNPNALSFGSKSYDGSAKITLTAGDLDALTSHQTIYTLTFASGAFASGSFTANSANKTINVPTTTSHVSEGSNLYFTNARAVSALTETLKAYVTLGGKQTITGEKNFTGGLKVNGSPIVYDSERKYWKLEGDLLVTGGVTMYGSDSSFTPSTIMDAIVVDNVTIIKQDGKLVALGGGLADEVAWGNVLGKPSWITDTTPSISISGTSVSLGGSITQSALRTALGLGSNAYTSTAYLPLSGGMLKGSGADFFQVNRTDGNPVISYYYNGSWLGRMGYNTNGSPVAQIGNDYQFLLHSGNIGSYNAGSATKLQTARTIWGQSFDGTGNVSGHLYLQNSHGIKVYDASGKNHHALVLDNANNMLFGSGTSSQGYASVLYGNHITFRYGTSQAVGMLLNSSGNVGIGTTSPSYKLDVNGITQSTALKTNSLCFECDSSGNTIDRGGEINRYVGVLHLQYATNKNITLCFGGGNVGIGIKDPSSRLHVSGDILATGGITTNDSVTINGIKLSKSKDGVLYLDGNLVVKGGVTMYGTDATSSPSILDSLPIASTSAKGIAQFNPSDFSVENGIVSFVGSVDGGVASSVAWGNITGKPTFATVATSGKYSDLNGLPTIPTIPSSLKNPYPLTINNSGGTAQVTYDGSEAKSLSLTKAMVGLGNVENTALSTWTGTNKITTLGTITSGTWNGSKIVNAYLANSSVTISGESVSLGGSITQSALRSALGLGSNAYTSTAYLPLSGGTITNTLQIGSNDNTSFLGLRIVRSGCALMLNHTSSNAYIGLGAFSNGTYSNKYMLLFGETGLKYSEDGQTTFKDILHSGNIGSYNAGSATKLQTARTIWGQSFDGTGNVDGTLELGNATYIKSFLPNSSTALNIFGLSSAKQLLIGYDSISASFDTSIYGGNIRLYYGNNLGFVLNSSGNVGIGTTSPSYKLDVNGITQSTALKTNSLCFECDSSGNTIDRGGEINRYVGVLHLQYATNKNITLCFGGGNVGIGIKDPSSRLHVSGDILATGGITMYSMRKLKNVVDERGLSLTELSTIKPTRYTWKDGRDNRLHIGGIADDIQQVLPEVVYSTSEGILTMDYGNAAFAVASSLIQPVVDHENRIAMLEEENKELRNEIERLKSA